MICCNLKGFNNYLASLSTCLIHHNLRLTNTTQIMVNVVGKGNEVTGWCLRTSTNHVTSWGGAIWAPS